MKFDSVLAKFDDGQSVANIVLGHISLAAEDGEPLVEASRTQDSITIHAKTGELRLTVGLFLAETDAERRNYGVPGLASLLSIRVVADLTMKRSIPRDECQFEFPNEGVVAEIKERTISGLKILDSSATFKPLAKGGYILDGIGAVIENGPPATAHLELDNSLFVRDGRVHLKTTEQYDVKLGEIYCATIPPGLKAEFELKTGSCKFSLAQKESGPLGTIAVPGFTDREALRKEVNSGTPKRFLFDLMELSVGADGVTAAGQVRKGTRILLSSTGAIRDIELEEGRVSVSRGSYSASATASAAVGYFSGATGRLSLAARQDSSAGKPVIGVTYQQDLRPWTDPTGLLTVNNPGVDVSITFSDEKWQVTGDLRGALAIRSERLVGIAADWLGDLLSSVQLGFSAKLGDITDGKLPNLGIDINFDSSTGSLDFWKIFKVNLSSANLTDGSLALINCAARFELPGGGLFEGTIPKLTLSFQNGSIAIKLGESIALAGQLRLPQGIHLELDLKQRGDVMEGSGFLQVPGIPGVSLTVRFGRELFPNSDQYVPVLLLYGAVPTAVTFAPGIVLRELGAGFGVNQRLEGLSAVQILAGKSPPEPDDLNAWKATTGSVAFVARGLFCPSAAGSGKEPFPYVGSLVLYLESGKDLLIAAYGKLWLFATLDEVRTPEFSSAPSANGIMTLQPKYGRLEAAFRTNPNGRIGSAAQSLGPLVKTLTSVSAEAYLLAQPDLFRLRIGPVSTAFELGPFAVSGTFRFATELRGDRVAALQDISITAAYDSRIEVKTGGTLSLNLGVQISASFHMDATVMLVLSKDRLLFYGRTSVSARASVSAWLAVIFDWCQRISLPFGAGFDIRIHWEASFTASLQVCLAADIEVLISNDGLAFEGQGTFSIDVCGYGFPLSASLSAGNTAAIGDARDDYKKLVKG